ncbi:hypothetical protein F5884DRAFT_768326 [Xylogone sp. PMI_703]|nr:hypothetical protein F5884DRAFT_768326 [Xylogone sp. PMI_703]
MESIVARSISRSCLQAANGSSTSAARAFLLVSARRQLHSSSTPVFDFLVPNITSRIASNGYRANTISQVPHCRGFASSSSRMTSAVINPRKDDDGNDMTVQITPRASNRLREIMTKDQNPNLALRIQVESGGCHGFQYLMSLTTLPPLPASGSPIGDEAGEIHGQPPALDTTLSQANPSPQLSGGKPPAAENPESKLDEDDTVFVADDGSGAKVVMDGPSLELLKGSKVDYTMELIGSQFKIVDNPLATSSCGCGTSFDIKV